MMLRHSFKLDEEACAIERAVERAVTDGARTVDIGGRLSTRQMTDEIINRIQ
jgi:3-isopropylmalate dehydrogenase